MKVAFLASDKAREQRLADAFLMGARRHGHQTRIYDLRDKTTLVAADVVCMCGVKSRELYQLYRNADVAVVYLDKGYARQRRPDGKGWEYWRFSVNAHQPTRRLAALAMPDDRWKALGLERKPWRTSGVHVVFAGSSQKYHDFHAMRGATDYARRIVRQIVTSGRPVIYRPKPSWDEAVPVPYSTMPEGQSLSEALDGAWALVTHGSSACFEAVLEGVPCVILGDAIARPISSTDIADLAAPRRARPREVAQWLANLAYFQWTLEEMAKGAAWDFIGVEIHA